MPSYKIVEVRIEVSPGVSLTAQVSTTGDLKELLDDLARESLWSAAAPARTEPPPPTPPPAGPTEDQPDSRIETRASIGIGSLSAAKVLAFKDGSPQLLRPGSFGSVSDATLSLLYAVEVGLKRPSISYDDLKVLFDAQNIKSGTPLPMLLTNLKNAGYLDKKTYATDRTVRLTAKGEKKAEEVIKSLCPTQS